jgi:hypothetical protein
VFRFFCPYTTRIIVLKIFIFCIGPSSHQDLPPPPPNKQEIIIMHKNIGEEFALLSLAAAKLRLVFTDDGQRPKTE